MSSNKYENNCIFSYNEVWERVEKHTDISNQTDLAKVVGVTQSAVSLRKVKDVWPEEWAYRIGRKYNLLTEWLLSGEGPRNLDEVYKKSNIDFPFLGYINQWLNELAIKDSKRFDWFIVAFKDAFPMFNEWNKRREQEESRSDSYPQDKIA